MSWLVAQYIQDLHMIKERGDINSDEFNNAILIEACINNLEKDGLLSEVERNIIDAVSYGYNFSEIARMFGMTRQRASKIFSSVTDRIAYYLGSEFTNTAFVERLKSMDEFYGKDVSELFGKRNIRADE